jgi:hypothetical protein
VAADPAESPSGRCGLRSWLANRPGRAEGVSSGVYHEDIRGPVRFDGGSVE